jgi:hypothetical protein
MIVADVISGGWVVGIVVLLICLVIGVCLIAGAFITSDDYDRWPFLIGGFVILFLAGGIWLWASWPLKYDYHHWVDIRGKVQRTSSRFISAGDNGGTNQRFVFVINGKAYGVDDTRASLTRVGNIVHLRCKKEHQFFQKYSDDGWACRWMNDSQISN